jgi:hypothetical protein
MRKFLAEIKQPPLEIKGLLPFEEVARFVPDLPGARAARLVA